MHEDEQNRQELSRRGFHRLATAAFGGVLTGILSGCGDQAGKPQATGSQAASKSTAAGPAAATKGAAVAGATTVAMHACRGLNECKGQGKDHKNACAGQGNCFTVTHECVGKERLQKSRRLWRRRTAFNDCKGKGGCGHFPIDRQRLWKKARESLRVPHETGRQDGRPAPAAAS